MKRFILILWLLSVAALVVQAAYYYSDLPIKMASHFDATGNPDAYSSREGFMLLWALMIVFMNAWVPLTRLLIKKIPPRLMNLPNRDYWLASDERRSELAGIMFVTVGGIFIGANIIMLIAFHQTVMVNMGQQSSLGLAEVLLLIPLILAYAIIYPLRRLRRTE